MKVYLLRYLDPKVLEGVVVSEEKVIGGGTLMKSFEIDGGFPLTTTPDSNWVYMLELEEQINKANEAKKERKKKGHDQKSLPVVVQEKKGKGKAKTDDQQPQQQQQQQQNKQPEDPNSAADPAKGNYEPAMPARNEVFVSVCRVSNRDAREIEVEL